MLLLSTDSKVQATKIANNHSYIRRKERAACIPVHRIRGLSNPWWNGSGQLSDTVIVCSFLEVLILASVLQNTVPLSDFQNQVSTLLCLSLSELHKEEGVESTAHNAFSVLQMTLRSGNSQSGPFSTLHQGISLVSNTLGYSRHPGRHSTNTSEAPPDSAPSLLFWMSS